MTAARYLLVDVFAETPFSGNQLAVFPDAEGLSTAQMQALARELNLAESTFVTPGAEERHFRVRIFTPAAELAFAGHPTIGTAVALDHLGRIKADSTDIVLEEGVGPVRVAVTPGQATLFMDGAPEVRACDQAPADLAASIGLRESDLAGAPWQASYGTPFVMLPVADRAAVARCGLQAEKWHALRPELWGRGAYVYAMAGGAAPEFALHARMFAPKLGVPEDPATGSAAAALVGSMDFGVPDGRCRVSIAQGVEMGRRSRISGQVTRVGGKVTGIAIGGAAVVVGEGRFSILP